MKPCSHRRNRVWLAIGILVVIVWGLASRKFTWIFPAVLGKYPGDALWTLAVFLGFALLTPRMATWRLAGLALAVSFLVEFSQLYHAPWIDGLRATTLGHLVLGAVFGWWDLLAYTVGAAIGATVDLACARRATRS